MILSSLNSQKTLRRRTLHVDNLVAYLCDETCGTTAGLLLIARFYVVHVVEVQQIQAPGQPIASPCRGGPWAVYVYRRPRPVTALAHI